LLRSAWQRLAWDPQQGLISDFSYVGRGEDCPICLFHEKLP